MTTTRLPTITVSIVQAGPVIRRVIRNYFQDPTSYSMGSAWDIFGRDEGESDAFRVDADYAVNDSSWLTNIKFGARRGEREQTASRCPG